jgi:HrpA-like RNA helicase
MKKFSFASLINSEKVAAPSISQLENLQVLEHREKIIKTIRENPVVIISAVTGSGKVMKILS